MSAGGADKGKRGRLGRGYGRRVMFVVVGGVEDIGDRGSMYELIICTTEGKPLKRFDLSRLGEAGGAGRAGTGGRGGRLLIGRADDCDIRIKNASVSRHHCSIEVDEDEDWVIRDLGSTLGTMVQGVKISEAAVESGLKVVVGPAVLMFARTVGSGAAAAIRHESDEA